MKQPLIPKQTAAVTAGVSFLAAIALAVGFSTQVVTAEAAAGTTLTFSDTAVSASGGTGGYEISGTDLTITAPGVYTLTGSCADGSVTVKKGTEGVTLRLDGLTLTSKDSAAVSCNKETRVTVQLSGTNTLTDGEDIANEEAEDFDGAAVKVKSGASLEIVGDGVLNVNGTCKNGVKGASLSSITVSGGTLNVEAANNGLAGDNAVTIAGGTVNVTAGNDGIKAEPDEDDAESAGTVTVTGGTITVNAQGDGVQCTGDLTVSGGTLNVTSGDDAVKSDTNVNVTAGTLTIRAADDGIHADYVLTVGVKGAAAGPDITIEECEEGLEGAAVELWSGKAAVTSADDGINAANSDLTGYDYHISIDGGSWYVNANGDGLDSNGAISITGGVTEVYGSANNGNNALDYDGLCTVENGTLFTVDCAGMNQVPSYGTYVVFGKTAGMGGGMPQMGGDRQAMGRDGQTGGRGPMFGQTGGAASDGGFGRPENMTPPDWTGGSGQMPTPPDWTGGGQMPTPPEWTGGGQMPAPPDQNGENGQMPTPPDRNGAGFGGAVDTSAIDIRSGSRIEVKDSGGKTLYSAVGTKTANCVMLASDDLTAGETYTLYVDGEEIASAQAQEGNGQGGMGFGPGGQMGGQPGGQGQQPGQNAAAEEENLRTTGYRDVTSNAWYRDAVEYVTEQGVMNGTGGDRFSPDVVTDRAMVVTILYRLEGSPAVSGSSFRDVSSGSYYADAVAWAEENGIVNGTGAGTFSPEMKITREQLATILYRYARSKGYDVSRTDDLSAFTDASSVQSYAGDAMRWACGSGLIQGADNRLMPGDGASRAQVAAILQRLSAAAG